LLRRFSCSPWTLLQLTDTITAADRILISDSRLALRIIPITGTILVTILITMATAIRPMVLGSAITARIMVMVTDTVGTMVVTTVVIAADIMVGIAADTTVDIMADIAVDIMAVIAADTMVDIAVDTMEDMVDLFRNSVHINQLVYS
jgi:hypothetical protein